MRPYLKQNTSSWKGWRRPFNPSTRAEADLFEIEASQIYVFDWLSLEGSSFCFIQNDCRI